MKGRIHQAGDIIHLSPSKGLIEYERSLTMGCRGNFYGGLVKSEIIWVIFGDLLCHGCHKESEWRVSGVFIRSKIKILLDRFSTVSL